MFHAGLGDKSAPRKHNPRPGALIWSGAGRGSFGPAPRSPSRPLQRLKRQNVMEFAAKDENPNSRIFAT